MGRSSRGKVAPLALFFIAAMLVSTLGSALVPGASTRPVAAAGPVRMMPLGDSLTDGYNVPGGYRVELWQSFLRGGYAVDFVGSLANGPTALGDRNHEGHSGWRIDQIAASVDGWLVTHTPERVLLIVGTNDVIQNYALDTAPDRLGSLIDRIADRAPGAHVLVGSIPPIAERTSDGRCQTSVCNQRVVAYNAAIPAIVEQRRTQGKKVGYVDMYNALSTSDLADGIHPTAAGYAKMANVWFAALEAGGLLGTPVSPSPTSTLTPTATASSATTTLVKGINLNGGAVTIAGEQWLSHAGALASGLTLGTHTRGTTSLVPNPSVDAATSQMLNSVVWVGSGNLRLAQTLAAGEYQTFLWVMENYQTNRRSFDVRLEGRVAATGIARLPRGSWVRYGPYPVTVADGRLDVELVRVVDAPHLMGLEIRQAGSSGGGTTPTASATPSPTGTHAPSPTGTSTHTPTTVAATATSTPTSTATPTPTQSPSAGRFTRAINLNGGSVTTGGRVWTSYADALNNGLVVGSVNRATTYISPVPGVDSGGYALLNSAIWRGGTNLSFYQTLPSGQYQVHLWVMENYRSNVRAFDLRLEGSLIARGLGDLAIGARRRYGPYDVAVADGRLDVDLLHVRGDPHLMGLEIDGR